jgi:hypothetical protein
MTRQDLLALQALQEMANLFEEANGRLPQSNHDLAEWAASPEGEATLLRHGFHCDHGDN